MMIGYGRTMYPRGVDWPLDGLALQKGHISVYISVETTEALRGPLGEKRMDQGKFSLVRIADLRGDAVALMQTQAAKRCSDPLQT
jgi:hypothetical protein